MKTAVKETLSNSFGEINKNSSIYQSILDAVRNAVEDNKADYLYEIQYVRQGSFLAGLDEVNLDLRFRQTAEASITYIIMERLGLEPKEMIDRTEFEYIRDFNTRDTISILGSAVSDISETALREISRTIAAERKAEREKFAQSQSRVYNGDENISERSQNNDRYSIQNRGGLSASDDRSPQNAGDAGQIRNDEERVSKKPQKNAVHTSDDVGRDIGTSATNGQRSDRTDTDDRRTDGEGGKFDGSDESQRPIALDGADEQLFEIGGGNGSAGRGVQLSLFDMALPSEEEQRKMIQKAEQNSSAFHMPFSMPQQVIDEVLADGANERDSVLDICVQYSKNKSHENNIEFLKNHYGTGGKGFIFDDKKVSVWWNTEGMRIAYGDTAIGKGQLLSWEWADARIDELLTMGRYAPQETLDKIDEYERSKAASAFWYMYRDINYDEYPEIRLEFNEAWFEGGYPDSTKRIKELLANPDERKKIISAAVSVDVLYAENTDIMRFTMYSPDKVFGMLDDL